MFRRRPLGNALSTLLVAIHVCILRYNFARVAVGVLVLSTCTGSSRASKHEQVPETGGMAVVDCEVKNYDLDDLLIRIVTLGRAKPSWHPDAGFIVPVSGGKAIKAKMVSGLLVFRGLSPGDYRLQRIEQGMARHEKKHSISGGLSYTESWEEGNVFEFESGIHRLPAFQVVAGRLTYVGKLIVTGTCNRSDRIGTGGSVCSWGYEVATGGTEETKALRQLRKHHLKPPWAKPVEDRLQELQQASGKDTTSSAEEGETIH